MQSRYMSEFDFAKELDEVNAMTEAILSGKMVIDDNHKRRLMLLGYLFTKVFIYGDARLDIKIATGTTLACGVIISIFLPKQAKKRRI